MKLFVTDLDGTLLNSNNQISRENIEALKLAHEKGIEIAIATGRTYADAISICKKANISAHIISNNGSLIHSKTGNKLMSSAIDKKHVKEILNWLTDNEYFFEISTAKNMFYLSEGKKMLENDFYKAKVKDSSLNIEIVTNMINLVFSQKGISAVNSIEDIISSDLEYYCITAISFNKSKLDIGRNLFKNHEDLSMVVSNEYNFEMVNVNASKGNCLECLAKHLNIPLKDVVAIGDNYNDISMFKKAGTSIAMGNADDDIKRICNYVSTSNDLNGVAHAIHEFLPDLDSQSSPA